MAPETPLVAKQARRRLGRLRQQVERGAGDGILGGHFDETAAHPGDRHVVVEENRPRIRGPDQPSLQARRREHGDLRFDRDVERPQQRAQVARARLEREPLVAALQSAVQLGGQVGTRDGAVGDRRVIQIDCQLGLLRPRDRARQGEEQRGSEPLEARHGLEAVPANPSANIDR
ncbi:hypothetical protein D3C83_15510 [compost metagenome]